MEKYRDPRKQNAAPAPKRKFLPSKTLRKYLKEPQKLSLLLLDNLKYFTSVFFSEMVDPIYGNFTQTVMKHQYPERPTKIRRQATILVRWLVTWMLMPCYT